MKKIVHIIGILLFCWLLSACKETQIDKFVFEVRSDSVMEGNPLPLTVSITHGDYYGYRMDVLVNQFDIVTGEKTVVNPSEYSVISDGEPIGDVVNFPDYGRRDFFITGLPASTYWIRVKLILDGFASDQNIVTVVYQKIDPTPDPPTPPTPPEEDIPVTSLAFPDLELQDGKLNLTVGDERKYAPYWEPEDATLIDFYATSSNESVVSAFMQGGVLNVVALSPGESLLTVSVEEGPEFIVPVVVKPQTIDVDSFEIDGLVLVDDRVTLEDPETREYKLSWLPSDATEVSFVASSSDKDIVDASVVDGKLVIKSVYPGDAVVTVSSPSGINKSFCVRVHKKVIVTIEWDEAEATDSQIATKTFPCDLVVSSDSKVPFNEPATFTLALEGTVNVTGRDSETKRVAVQHSFYGDRAWRYNVSSNFLLECYMIYKTSDYSLNIKMALSYFDSLDQDYWTIEYNEKYKTQEARIRQYITKYE